MRPARRAALLGAWLLASAAAARPFDSDAGSALLGAFAAQAAWGHERLAEARMGPSEASALLEAGPEPSPSADRRGWSFKWGRIMRAGGEVALIRVERRGAGPDATVALEGASSRIGSQACMKSRDPAWPLWFCLPEERPLKRTLVYLLRKWPNGTDDNATLGGLIAEAPYTGFLVWSRLVFYAGKGAEFLQNAKSVTLDVASEQLVVTYVDSRDDTRIALKHPSPAGEMPCMEHAGPLPPVLLCLAARAKRLQVYAYGPKGSPGKLLAEAL